MILSDTLLLTLLLLVKVIGNHKMMHGVLLSKEWDLHNFVSFNKFQPIKSVFETV